jgi:antitoxin component YwqK of YwqJK toxin-antitoxin module
MIKYLVSNTDPYFINSFSSNKKEYKNYKYWIVKHYKNCKLHKENGPAIYNSMGSYYYYNNGKIHREDGPAVEEFSVNDSHVKVWYLNGLVHNENSHAYEYIKNNQLKKVWYLNNKKHRDNNPAIEYYFNDELKVQYWYKNGKIHREDGPAYIYYSTEHYYLNNKPVKVPSNLKPEEFKKFVKLNIFY